jgi:hypothetical protein
MRDSVMADLVERVMTDEGFRQQARDDLDGALAGAGFELEPDEMAAVRQFHDEFSGVPDDELTSSLVRRQGGNG